MDSPDTPPPPVHDHLEDALAADTTTKKNYHIRSALQAFALVELEDEQKEGRQRARARNRS